VLGIAGELSELAIAQNGKFGELADNRSVNGYFKIG
jgi:hypothetical protein